MEITVKFGNSEIKFQEADIDKIEEMAFDNDTIISITLKDKRVILLPISKEEFERRIQNGETTFEISL